MSVIKLMLCPSKRFVDICVVLLIAAAVLAIYDQVATHHFIGFDDAIYVTDNYYVLQGVTWKGVIWAATSQDLANWQPLTLWSHMMDVEVFGLQAGGHALTNVSLHALASVLLFVFVLKLTRHRWVAAFVALVFAIHPANVESVAWIAERKSVLSAVFWFGTLGLYLGYVGKPAAWRYGAVVFIFGLALMAKPVVVTLPFVLLLLDFWPLGRWGAVRPLPHFAGLPQIQGGRPRRGMVLVAEKLPLMAMASAISWITLVAQRTGGAITDVHTLPLSERAANAVVGIVEYVRMFLCPGPLAVFYEFRLPEPKAVLMALSVVTILSLGAVVAIRRFPAALVGWFWFLGVSLPTLGLIQVGAQRIADRYLYLPMVGLALALAWAVALIPERWKRIQLILCFGAIPWVAWLAGRTFEQVKTWRDGIAVSEQTMKVGAIAPLMLNNLAMANSDGSNPAVAVELLGRMPAANAQARRNLGVLYVRLGRFQDAVLLLDDACRAADTPAFTHYHFAQAFAAVGRIAEARQQVELCRAKIPSKTQWRDSVERLRRIVNAPGFSVEQLIPSRRGSVGPVQSVEPKPKAAGVD